MTSSLETFFDASVFDMLGYLRALVLLFDVDWPFRSMLKKKRRLHSRCSSL
jgi:hypothetical protein